MTTPSRPVMTYPTRWLLGVIDDPAAAADAGDAVMADGIAADDVRVLGGAAGREQLAGLGSRPNVLSRLVRAVAFTTMDQLPDFLVYERAIEGGRAVVAVRVGSRAELQRVRRALERFGGHFLNYYGRLSTEELSLWRGEEPTIPDVLRR